MWKKAGWISALVVLSLSGPATYAATGDSLIAQPRVSASQAAAIVRGQHGGRVLSVVPSSRGDERGYRVRVLIGGERVKTVFIGDKRRSEQRVRKDPSRRNITRVRD